jgi:hypothetical protein
MRISGHLCERVQVVGMHWSDSRIVPSDMVMGTFTVSWYPVVGSSGFVTHSGWVLDARVMAGLGRHTIAATTVTSVTINP